MNATDRIPCVQDRQTRSHGCKQRQDDGYAHILLESHANHHTPCAISSSVTSIPTWKRLKPAFSVRNKPAYDSVLVLRRHRRIRSESSRSDRSGIRDLNAIYIRGNHDRVASGLDEATQLQSARPPGHLLDTRGITAGLLSRLPCESYQSGPLK